MFRSPTYIYLCSQYSRFIKLQINLTFSTFLPCFFPSTKVFILSLFSIGGGNDSHGSIGELLLGEVEGVVGYRDTVRTGVLSRWQIPPQNGIVGDAEEGHHAVPRHVVEPHLQK